MAWGKLSSFRKSFNNELSLNFKIFEIHYCYIFPVPGTLIGGKLNVVSAGLEFSFIIFWPNFDEEWLVFGPLCSDFTIVIDNLERDLRF